MTPLLGKDVLGKDPSQEAKEAIPEIRETQVPPKRNILFDLLMHFLTFLGGVLSAGLWLKFVFFHRFEVEWGKGYFRDPQVLFATTGFFFLMGMGLVFTIRHIIRWFKECRTY